MKKHIPNMITCCNLICGCVAIVFALRLDPQMALLFIILGALFDFFDGMSARLLGVSSEIGKELDSLADDVTFGVAPASMIFAELSVLEYPEFIIGSMPWVVTVVPYIAFLVAAFLPCVLQSSTLTHVRPPRSSDCQHLLMPFSGVHSS